MKSNILKLSTLDFRPLIGFVALYDILGYSSWIKEKALCDVWKDQMNMKEMIKVNTEYFNKNGPNKSIITVYNYADTFLIYTNDISDDAFHALIISCHNMFMAALDYGLPIRGATACGEFYVSQTDNIVIGKPIIKAHEDEENQDWIGCWISNECLSNIGEDLKQAYIKEKMIIKYPIPFKKGEINEDLYAYNLMYNMPDNITIEFLENKGYLQKLTSHGWSEERKHRNTKDFINFVLKQ
jgi:hypothetical protein